MAAPSLKLVETANIVDKTWVRFANALGPVVPKAKTTELRAWASLVWREKSIPIHPA